MFVEQVVGRLTRRPTWCFK